MKQHDIDKITEAIMSLNNNPNKIYEFICACGNAKMIIENKLAAEHLKQTTLAHIQYITKTLGGNI